MGTLVRIVSYLAQILPTSNNSVGFAKFFQQVSTKRRNIKQHGFAEKLTISGIEVKSWQEKGNNAKNLASSIINWLRKQAVLFIPKR
jgi:hypothetical protein